MARRFRRVDYEQSRRQTVTIGECLPPNHLAYFIVTMVAQLDLSSIYAQYAPVGGEAFAPEILLGLLLYGYATGVFSSRKIEKGSYETIPFRYIAGGLHPDHDTIANFRKTFLPQVRNLFVQVLVKAQEAGVLSLGNISLDGSKIHADASKSKAVSYEYLPKLEARLRAEVEELLRLADQADQADLPVGLDIGAEISFRQDRLVNLAQAKRVLEERAQARYDTEQAEYEAKVRQREQKAQECGHKPRGRAPQPPVPGARPRDQYNFTDPDSAIMKNSTNQGFDQHYNVQAAVEQVSLLIVAPGLSNHPVDTAEAIPTLSAIPAALGRPTRRRWTGTISARPPSKPCKPGALSRTLPPGANPISTVGASFLPRPRNPRPPRPVPSSRWPINCKPTSVKRFTACANVRLSRSSALSRRCWVFASSRCGA